MESNQSRGKVVGIGGIFFRSPDKKRLENWYRDALGIDSLPNVGAQFQWRAHDKPDREHSTAWSVFPQDTTYFGPESRGFMINYLVDDLDALLAKLDAAGARIDPNRESHEYGKFAWVYDADGNKIELWEPPK